LPPRRPIHLELDPSCTRHRDPHSFKLCSTLQLATSSANVSFTGVGKDPEVTKDFEWGTGENFDPVFDFNGVQNNFELEKSAISTDLRHERLRHPQRGYERSGRSLAFSKATSELPSHRRPMERIVQWSSHLWSSGEKDSHTNESSREVS
jgi:hypothetical protein